MTTIEELQAYFPKCRFTLSDYSVPDKHEMYECNCITFTQHIDRGSWSIECRDIDVEGYGAILQEAWKQFMKNNRVRMNHYYAVSNKIGTMRTTRSKL